MAEHDGQLNPNEGAEQARKPSGGRKQSYWERFRKLKLDHQVVLVSNALVATTTTVYVLVTLLTWLTIRNSATTSSQQTGKLIEAANIQAVASRRNADAAETFSHAAAAIQTNTLSAVGQLQRTASSAEQGLLNSAIQFRIEERPYVTLVGFPLQHIGSEYKTNFNFFNAGKTPALDFQWHKWDVRVGTKSQANPPFTVLGVTSGQVITAGSSQPLPITWGLNYPWNTEVENGMADDRNPLLLGAIATIAFVV